MKRAVITLAIISLWIAACQEHAPARQEAAGTVSPEAAAVFDLAGQLGTIGGEIRVVKSVSKEWESTCMLTPRPGETCAEGTYPGKEILLALGETYYGYQAILAPSLEVRRVADYALLIPSAQTSQPGKTMPVRFLRQEQVPEGGSCRDISLFAEGFFTFAPCESQDGVAAAGDLSDAQFEVLSRRNMDWPDSLVPAGQALEKDSRIARAAAEALHDALVAVDNGDYLAVGEMLSHRALMEIKSQSAPDENAPDALVRLACQNGAAACQRPAAIALKAVLPEGHYQFWVLLEDEDHFRSLDVVWTERGWMLDHLPERVR